MRGLRIRNFWQWRHERPSAGHHSSFRRDADLPNRNDFVLRSACGGSRLIRNSLGNCGMSFFGQLANLFSRSGRDDTRLKQGMDLASAKRPDKAIGIYDSILGSKTANSTVRARALFNRALAHSSMKDDEKAIADLEGVASMGGAPENVRTAARNQLIRVRNRVERDRSRAER